MLILICIVPTYYSINPNFDTGEMAASLARIEQIIVEVDASTLSASDQKKLADSRTMNTERQTIFSRAVSSEAIDPAMRFQVRKDILVIDRNLNSLKNSPDLRLR